MMFSQRLPPHTQTNALTQAVNALTARGAAIVDLTESNPTRAGIPYPGGLLAALADPRALEYEPHPFGLPSARAAVAVDQRRRGARVDPAHVVLTASTSEAYSWLFKLLCNPGESVLVPRPSYPLFEHLTRLEGVRAEPYDLEFHGRWEVNLDAIRTAPADIRAIVVVSPNNPTGSYLSRAELEGISLMCRERQWALVADEVFADYPLESSTPLTDVAATSDVLSFTLAGLSKSAGLPQVKLGWVIAGGPPAPRDAALAALELVADSFLSVGTPVQVALPDLLGAGHSVRTAIQQRTRRNLDALREAIRQHPGVQALPVEGGWSAVVRVPATRSEEDLVLEVLNTEHVLVHPGYFFDFPGEAFIVLSLLAREEVFAAAVPRVLRVADC